MQAATCVQIQKPHTAAVKKGFSSFQHAIVMFLRKEMQHKVWNFGGGFATGPLADMIQKYSRQTVPRKQ